MELNDPNVDQVTGTVIRGENLMKNMRQFELFFIIIYMLSGIISGILGLKNLQGIYFLLLVFAILFVSCLVKLKFNSKDFILTSYFLFHVNFLMSQFASFILLWTFTYALIHLY